MNEIITNEELNIEDTIYEIRGKQVILDFDLAKLYHVETKRINEAVRRNPEKFPNRFAWKLTDEESKIFLVAICDQKIETRGGKYKNPMAFTEQGVAMLATILKSSIAIQVSIRIMDAFVAMHKYISNNLIEQKIINNIVLDNQKEIKEIKSDIKLLQESFKKFEEKKIVNEIYYSGQIYDAYSKIVDISKTAKKTIVVIDGYCDKTTLDIIKNTNVKTFLITKRKSNLKTIDINKYNKQYHNLKIIYNETFHDRYIIIDNNIIYHCGASINYAGSRTFSINILEDNIVKHDLIININNEIKGR